MRHTVIGTAIIALISSMMVGCAQKPVTTAPKIECEKIEIKQGEEFDFQDYCIVTAGATITMEDFDPNKIGTQEVEIIVNKNGSMTVTTIPITVVEKDPECPANSKYNKDKKACECIKGYEQTESGCKFVLANTPEPEQTEEPVNTDEPIKTEEPVTPTVQPTAQPQQTQQPVQQPAQQPAQQTQPVQHGTQYFYPDQYGGFDEAFNACVSACQGMAGACECGPTDAYDGYVLTY